VDYRGRLSSVRQQMAKRGIDVMFLPRGSANLFYLTGFRRPLEHGSDKNAYGDWASGAWIGRDGGLVVLAPRMGGIFEQGERQGKDWVDDVWLIQEQEQPADVMRRAIREVAGSVMRIAIDDHAWAETTLALRDLFPNAAQMTTAPILGPMRMIKDADEIAVMKRASAAADEAFRTTLPILKPGVSEFEVAREIDYQFQKAGADYTSFESNVSFVSPREGTSRTLLRTSLGRRLEYGDSVTFDFGCVVDGYCSDFGRSAFVGEPPEEYRRIHQIVLDAQAAAIPAMKADQITASEANGIARTVIADAGYDAGFTHRLGHGIGIALHEPPYLDAVNDTVLQAGMTFTVEPSIRIPGKFGNRVEDVVLVTEQGGEVFNSYPHDLVIVL
jgi:Xaa-Pro aminopeptidase